MRVERCCIVTADRDAVWKVVSDPHCYPSFLANLERWETETEGRVGLGARYTVHWKIGSVPIGGTVEVVEFDNARDLAWTGITGMTVRGRFRLRDAGPGQTRVTFRLTYQAPGGVLGLIADRVAAPQVRHTLAESLKNLKKLLES
jgi:uncharacterized membrane protein